MSPRNWKGGRSFQKAKITRKTVGKRVGVDSDRKTRQISPPAGVIGKKRKKKITYRRMSVDVILHKLRIGADGTRDKKSFS